MLEQKQMNELLGAPGSSLDEEQKVTNPSLRSGATSPPTSFQQAVLTAFANVCAQGPPRPADWGGFRRLEISTETGAFVGGREAAR